MNISFLVNFDTFHAILTWVEEELDKAVVKLPLEEVTMCVFYISEIQPIAISKLTHIDTVEYYGIEWKKEMVKVMPFALFDIGMMHH